MLPNKKKISRIQLFPLCIRGFTIQEIPVYSTKYERERKKYIEKINTILLEKIFFLFYRVPWFKAKKIVLAIKMGNIESMVPKAEMLSYLKI